MPWVMLVLMLHVLARAIQTAGAMKPSIAEDMAATWIGCDRRTLGRLYRWTQLVVVPGVGMLLFLWSGWTYVDAWLADTWRWPAKKI